MDIARWISKIDEGAFSKVWKAEDHLGRIVAVKLIEPSAAQLSGALDHARALARAKHPNVVDVYYVAEVIHPETGEPVLAVVMEHLSGVRLDVLLKGRALGAQQVRSIGLGIIAAIEHIHAQGLAHGDLHGGNVMVNGADVKVIDILYLDTLQLMTTMSRDMKIQRDYLQLRMLLADLIGHSSLDFGEVRAFSARASSATTLAEIRDAFLAATDLAQSASVDRRIAFAFERFSDPQFVGSEAYAEALDAETDDDVVLPLLRQIIQSEQTRPPHQIYIARLWNRLPKAGQDQILGDATAHLSSGLPKGEWFPHMVFLDALGGHAWLELPRIPRLRIESIMINDILEGRFDIFATINRGGELATWILGRGELFDDRDGLIENTCTMLKRDWYTQNFIAKYLMPTVPLLGDTPRRRMKLIAALRVAVGNDAKIVKANLYRLPVDWRKELEA